jgi:hypothetical protein
MGLGFWFALDHAMGRFESAVADHAGAVRDAGSRVGMPVSNAITNAGQTIAHPEIRVVDPLPIKEPVKIRGVKDDGALPVDARLAK